jgi:Flp pilus assembly protein TadD
MKKFIGILLTAALAFGAVGCGGTTTNETADEATTTTAAAVRQYKERLGYSEQWMTEYVYNVVMLAKKEPKQKANEEK